MSAELAGAIREVLARQAREYIRNTALRAAVSHLLGRGKLYRPLLALAVYEAITGADPAEYVSVVAPLELIHTFTLIHDDLPCMDDAQLRRGVRAVHLEFGEAVAVLAGDALCMLAFQVLAQEAPDLSQRKRLELISSLSTATQAVIAGQVDDMAAELGELDVAELTALHSRKTGALLGASCEFGAILADASGETRMALRTVGEQIGLLFQVRDDLLSVTSSEEASGKTLSTDATRGKSTFARLLGVEGAREYGLELLARTGESIASLGLRDARGLQDLARLAFLRES